METAQEKSPSQILLEAASLLENEVEWGQGYYFKFPYSKETDASTACIMCAHGAIAYCGSEVVRDSINKFSPFAANTMAGSNASYAFAAREREALYYTNCAKRESLTLEQYLAKYYGGNVTVAHYRADMAGLTFEFNDAPGRTKQEVIDILREAANLVHQT